MKIGNDELKRLEGRDVYEDDWRACMWRRSYLIAINAIRSLEQRLVASKRSSVDAPMVFFYPDSE